MSLSKFLERASQWVASKSNTKLTLYTVLFAAAIGLYSSLGFHFADLDHSVRLKEKAETLEELYITRNAVLAKDQVYLAPFGDSTRGKIDYAIMVLCWPVVYIAWPFVYYLLYYTVGGHFLDLAHYTISAFW